VPQGNSPKYIPLSTAFEMTHSSGISHPHSALAETCLLLKANPYLAPENAPTTFFFTVCACRYNLVGRELNLQPKWQLISIQKNSTQLFVPPKNHFG
jgi:hypothetical protein